MIPRELTNREMFRSVNSHRSLKPANTVSATGNKRPRYLSTLTMDALRDDYPITHCAIIEGR
ncbi:MAG: hypothetical protein JO354_08780 [Verrucomicrobia bacterium]|nr:hypothetical protein [Verrucomicrobiota bacterium]